MLAQLRMMSRRNRGGVGRWVLAVALLASVDAGRAADRIPIKAIVLCGFEVGDDSGDAPGEFQYWVEREKLTEVIEVPGAAHGAHISHPDAFAAFVRRVAELGAGDGPTNSEDREPSRR